MGCRRRRGWVSTKKGVRRWRYKKIFKTAWDRHDTRARTPSFPHASCAVGGGRVWIGLGLVWGSGDGLGWREGGCAGRMRVVVGEECLGVGVGRCAQASDSCFPSSWAADGIVLKETQTLPF